MAGPIHMYKVIFRTDGSRDSNWHSQKKVFGNGLLSKLVVTANRWSRSHITLYALIIALAEILTAYYEPQTGMILHAVIMFALFAHAAFLRPSDKQMSYLLMSIGIAPLIRIASLSAPLAPFSYISWFLILSVPLYTGILILAAFQELKQKDLGLTFNFRMIHWEIAIALLGCPLGFVEYYILTPGPLITSITLADMIAPVLIIVVCSGLIVELIFRGLVQYNSIRIFGGRGGILLTSVLFGFLHIGNLNPPSVVFAFAVGVIYSLVVLRTKSIVGVSISHGTLNCMLFLVAPAYL